VTRIRNAVLIRYIRRESANLPCRQTVVAAPRERDLPLSPADDSRYWNVVPTLRLHRYRVEPIEIGAPLLRLTSQYRLTFSAMLSAKSGVYRVVSTAWGGMVVAVANGILNPMQRSSFDSVNLPGIGSERGCSTVPGANRSATELSS
jgi:hypothetical protein